VQGIAVTGHLGEQLAERRVSHQASGTFLGDIDAISEVAPPQDSDIRGSQPRPGQASPGRRSSEATLSGWTRAGR
jgi:hypothetical protein